MTDKTCSLFLLLLVFITSYTFSMEQPEELVPTFFTNETHRECIQMIKKTVIATRAAWHAAQVQDQKIDIILFSEIMKIIHKHYNTLTLHEAFSIINYAIKAYDNPIIHRRVDPIAQQTFQQKHAQENSNRIDAVYAAKDAVLHYLRQPEQADI